jgi:hypothetical protein
MYPDLGTLTAPPPALVLELFHRPDDADQIVYASGAWQIASRADILSAHVIGLVDRETLLDALADEQDTDTPQAPTLEWAAEFGHDQLLGRIEDLLEGGYPYDEHGEDEVEE